MKTFTFDAHKVGHWVCARTGGTFDGVGAGIGLEEDGKLIAGVLYDNYNGRSISMHVASDNSKRWMTREYLRICFDYPFRQLGVNVIIGLVDSQNLAARRFDEALGFQLEHVIPSAGSKGDLIIYTMTAAQCRFLDIKERQIGREIVAT